MAQAVRSESGRRTLAEGEMLFASRPFCLSAPFSIILISQCAKDFHMRAEDRFSPVCEIPEIFCHRIFSCRFFCAGAAITGGVQEEAAINWCEGDGKSLKEGSSEGMDAVSIYRNAGGGNRIFEDGKRSLTFCCFSFFCMVCSKDFYLSSQNSFQLLRSSFISI